MYRQAVETEKQTSGCQGTISALADHRAAIESRIREIEKQNRRLDREEKLVDEKAASLESKIREFAQEEIRLQQRKKQLRVEARVIGELRKSIQDRHRTVARNMGNAQAEVLALDARRAEAERQRALEEAQKRTNISSRTVSAGTWDIRERRASPRIAVEVNVSMHTEHNFYTGLTRDLSEGGLFIATVEHLPVGTELDLTVSLPDYAPIRALGRVCWVREYNQFNQDFHPGVGVKFIDLAEDDRRAIERFLRAREPLLYDPEVM